jgi:hypothetical protein
MDKKQKILTLVFFSAVILMLAASYITISVDNKKNTSAVSDIHNEVESNTSTEIENHDKQSAKADEMVISKEAPQRIEDKLHKINAKHDTDQYELPGTKQKMIEAVKGYE